MKLLKKLQSKVTAFARRKITEKIDGALTKLYAKKESVLLAGKSSVKKTGQGVKAHRLTAGVLDGQLVSLKLDEGTHLERNSCFIKPQDEYQISMTVSVEDFRKTQRNIRLLQDVKAIINGD